MKAHIRARRTGCRKQERHIASPQPFAAGAVPPSGRQTWPIETDFSFFLRPYHRLTRPREKKTDENIDVMMPRQWTTAKPRTGPEPKVSSASQAISVVTFESRIVAQARS